MKALLVSDEGGVSIIPDSAITTQGRPVTLPIGADSWTLSLGIAYRIGRLGKAISAKFAHRYIDGVTLALLPRPADATAEAVTIATAGAYDCALTLGEWLEPDGEETCRIGGGDPLPAPDVSSAIAAMTPWMTLKTGDVIIFPLPLYATPLMTRNGLWLNGRECLKRRVM